MYFLFSSFSHFIYAFYVLYTVFCLYNEINFIITVSSISNRQCIHRRKPSLLQSDFNLRTRPLIYNVNKKQLVGKPCLKPVVVVIIAATNIICVSAVAASQFNQTIIDERLSWNSIVGLRSQHIPHTISFSGTPRNLLIGLIVTTKCATDNLSLSGRPLVLYLERTISLTAYIIANHTV